MKAIRVHQFGGPEVLLLEEVPDLGAGEGQAVVRIYAVGVNPFDTYIRSGSYAIRPQLPYTPGADAAGVVSEVGSGVKDFRVGDRVYVAGTLSGAYAAYTLCRASQLHPLPKNISFQQGAAMGVPYATAYRALFDKARGLPAETVLVQNSRTLDDLVREMLRPMLKAWLDDNLPTLVERMVRAEIERVSRGR